MKLDAFRQDLIQKLGEENLRKIETAHIGIAGAGGLGSNCAMNLVRVGFKKLTIVDFDQVEPTNLDRQFFFADQIGMNKTKALQANLLRINPDLELNMRDLRVEDSNVFEIFRDCDVVVECFDRAEAKSMLVSGLLPTGKLIVTGSGLGGIGSSDEIQTHWIKKNLVIIGDLHSDIKTKPALAPRVSLAAAKQADVVLDYVIRGGNFSPTQGSL